MINIRCVKTAVSGSTRGDVETIFEAFRIDRFAEDIAADDIKKGEPDPSAFIESRRRTGLQPSEGVVVENAPLGAKAAENAVIESVVVQANTPFEKADFGDAISNRRIFEKTGTLRGMLGVMCT
ncbi:MAG: HAD hydrolase-like protein [Nitrososphaera sp.]|nr:HAD hydrolase-like protein [Nitrososphaera sp.]